MSIGYKKNPMPPAHGLPAEDNYQIEVWDRKDGELLGICLKSSMSGITHQAWPMAIKEYPGRYLAETNGQYVLKEAVAPTGEPDARGWIAAKDVQLHDLPQWYGLVARCACGHIKPVDRYDSRVMKWQYYPLTDIAEKLSCSECKKAGRKTEVELGLVKLPR